MVGAIQIMDITNAERSEPRPAIGADGFEICPDLKGRKLSRSEVPMQESLKTLFYDFFAPSLPTR